MLAMLDKQYISILSMHAATAVVAKLSLLIGLCLVQFGNDRKGPPLLTSILLVHFLVGAFTTAGSIVAMNALAVASGAMMLACAWALGVEHPKWRAIPDAQPWTALTIIGYIIAFWFPFWPAQGFIKAFFFSPTAALPHQGLLAVLILTAASPAGSRVIKVTGAMAAIVVGIVEIKYGSSFRAIIMLAAGIAGSVPPLLAFSRSAASDLGDAMKQKADSDAAPSNTEDDSPKKKWNLR
ncbi:hypothetical protein IT570_03840 [Candidatus Sumerlaeota bacterium]|nr:hypothetical protein [Candidatus Sumerlaeota bacterium]